MTEKPKKKSTFRKILFFDQNYLNWSIFDNFYQNYLLLFFEIFKIELKKIICSLQNYARRITGLWTELPEIIVKNLLVNLSIFLPDSERAFYLV